MDNWGKVGWGGGMGWEKGWGMGWDWLRVDLPLLEQAIALQPSSLSLSICLTELNLEDYCTIRLRRRHDLSSSCHGIQARSGMRWALENFLNFISQHTDLEYF